MRAHYDIPFKGRPGLNGALWVLAFVAVVLPVEIIVIGWAMGRY